MALDRHSGGRRSCLGAAVTLAATIAAAAAFGARAAAVPLQNDSHITDSLRAAAVADQIRKTCPTISGRMILAFIKAQALYDYALRQGHSQAEISAFLKDPAQKARLKALTRAYITSHGAKPGDANSLCALGEREMAAKSLTGRLLRN